MNKQINQLASLKRFQRIKGLQVKHLISNHLL